MSAVSADLQPCEPVDEPTTEPEFEIEEPVWQPRRIRVPRWLAWGVLFCFALVVIVAGVWGLAHSTLTYGMSPVDAGTSARLAQVRRELAVAGVPESALRRLAAAARPGINIGDAIEALVDADRDLETWSKIPAVAAARAELRSILARLDGRRYGTRYEGTPAALTPLPTLILPGP